MVAQCDGDEEREQQLGHAGDGVRDERDDRIGRTAAPPGEDPECQRECGAEREREDILCVNPLTGTQNGVAAPEANSGTLVPSKDLRSGSLVPGRVGARCEKSLLLLEGDIPVLGPYVLPGNNYHVYDYALFWAAVRRDAERRLAAWRP